MWPKNSQSDARISVVTDKRVFHLQLDSVGKRYDFQSQFASVIDGLQPLASAPSTRTSAHASGAGTAAVRSFRTSNAYMRKSVRRPKHSMVQDKHEYKDELSEVSHPETSQERTEFFSRPYHKVMMMMMMMMMTMCVCVCLHVIVCVCVCLSACLSVLSSLNDPFPTLYITAQVIVVGAGLAGITAAKHLKEAHGIIDVLVLGNQWHSTQLHPTQLNSTQLHVAAFFPRCAEATPRVGGRVRPLQLPTLEKVYLDAGGCECV